MPDPVLLLIDDSRGHDRVEEELRKRYGADYEVLAAVSVGEALGVLDRLHAEGRQLSMGHIDAYAAARSPSCSTSGPGRTSPGSRRSG